MDLSAKHRLAVMASYRDTTPAGGLMSYSADHCAYLQRAATVVDRILKGAKAADLPVEQLTKFELVINRGGRQEPVTARSVRTRSAWRSHSQRSSAPMK